MSRHADTLTLGATYNQIKNYMSSGKIVDVLQIQEPSDETTDDGFVRRLMVCDVEYDEQEQLYNVYVLGIDYYQSLSNPALKLYTFTVDNADGYPAYAQGT